MMPTPSGRSDGPDLAALPAGEVIGGDTQHVLAYLTTAM